MGAADGEAWNARADPGDVVLSVGGVIDWGRTTRRSEEPKFMQGHVVEKWEENFTEGPVRKRVPELAPRTWRRSERHLAAGTPHGRRAWSSWSLHRALSMESGRGRLESNGDPDSAGRWLSGRKHPPAKRVGGVKLPRGFESLPSRHFARSRAIPVETSGPPHWKNWHHGPGHDSRLLEWRLLLLRHVA